jgi:hypothetical protein
MGPLLAKPFEKERASNSWLEDRASRISVFSAAFDRSTHTHNRGDRREAARIRRENTRPAPTNEPAPKRLAKVLDTLLSSLRACHFSFPLRQMPFYNAAPTISQACDWCFAQARLCGMPR